MQVAIPNATPDVIVLTRMAEFFARGSSWHRRLWTVGTPLMLEEVAEYAAGVRDGLLRPEGLTYVAASAVRQVKRDLGIDGPAGTQALLELLDAPPTGKHPLLDPSVADSFGEHIRRCRDGYLDRWVAASQAIAPDDAELVARLVAGHLMDEGFATDHLHGWLKSQADQGLSHVLDSAAEIARRPSRTYEVWVPYTRIPSQVRSVAGNRFMSHADFLQMLDERRIAHPNVRAGAGVLRFDVAAREPRAALVATELEVRRLRSRCVVGDPGERPEPAGMALVLTASSPNWHKLPQHGRLLIPSLREHSGLLPDPSQTYALDDALELLASVETSTTWASLAAIWAAIEGLLARPGLKEPGTAAADRAADLVTCSLPAAELRALRDETDDSAPSTSLDDLLASINAGRWDAKTLPSYAAGLRLSAMAADPQNVLGRVRCYFRDAFRRLYNQRNLVMHGGRFDSVALPAAMRTMPPLVGAAFDRIIHALSLGNPTPPLSLAARAGNELDLAGKPGARPITKLLD